MPKQIPLVEKVSSYRGMAMAVALGSAMAFALSTMLVMGVDTKAKEGHISPYDSGKAGRDLVMTSGDVSATVSIPRPGKERFPVPLNELPPAMLRSGSIRVPSTAAAPPAPVSPIPKTGKSSRGD